ncbi:MAG: quinolinate synthase NadA, partial [Planctomycetota bacterium]
FILWKGFCHVHQIFTADHVAARRAEMPGVRVIVHPECPREVVAAADASGSTAQIIRTIADAAPGTKWTVGTEANLVNRLATQFPDRTITLLSDRPALCWQMGKIDLPHLLWILDSLATGNVVNTVTVPPAIAADARIALQRMIDIKAAQNVTPGDQSPS